MAAFRELGIDVVAYALSYGSPLSMIVANTNRTLEAALRIRR